MDAADVDVAVLEAGACWKRFCGEACSVIYQVGDRVAVGAVAVALVAVDSEAAAVAVLAVVLVVETVLVEVARVAVGDGPARRYGS